MEIKLQVNRNIADKFYYRLISDTEGPFDTYSAAEIAGKVTFNAMCVNKNLSHCCSHCNFYTHCGHDYRTKKEG
jgi:hypothetical protein